jgi:hypothetical protein
MASAYAGQYAWHRPDSDHLGAPGEQEGTHARMFGISVWTLRDWEHDRRPDGPARALLRVIEREPEAAWRALGG